MATPYSTPQRGAVVVSPYAGEEPMPAGATGTLLLLASGFGIGALVILFGFGACAQPRAEHRRQ